MDKKNDLNQTTEVSLGIRLRQLRYNRGWTQEQTAKQGGFTTNSWQRWESDKHAPNISDMAKIAKMFNITYNDLLKGIIVNGDSL